jgi:hypothetical protein
MARVHGSRTHHGTQSAPSAVLKTEDITGCLALSREFPKKLVSNLPPHAAKCRVMLR